MLRTLTIAAAALALAVPAAAIAHHGWAWTEDEESRLEGTIATIDLGNPHARLTLRNRQGVWNVDLASPMATARAGFVEGTAKPGDRVVLTGHRARDAKMRQFKAETITVRGKTYDVYPARPKTLTRR